MVWVLFGGFMALIVLRVPVTMAMGASVLAALVFAGFEGQLYILPRQVLDGVESPALLAIPFFVLAGSLMNAVGLTDRIFNFASALVGHFKAGLAQVNVVGSMIFAGVQGSAVADIAGLGQIEIKAMRDRGYPADFAAALTVVSALMGPIIPPSISLVIYAFLSNTSVARLFLGGVIPGVLLGVSLMVYNRMIADRRGFPREPRASLRHVFETGVHGIAALVAPGIIMSAIVFGYTTSTEAGVVACIYALILGALYRTLDWRKLLGALSDTCVVTGIVMIIIGFSQVMGWLLAIEQVPQELAQAMLAKTDDRYVFLGLLVLFLLAIGTVVEGIPAMIVLVPVMLPMVDHFGIDRVHFGLIITYGLLIGMASPPVGVGLYIAVEISGVPFERLCMAVLPFMVPLTIAFILVTFIPGLTLWLPNLILGLE